MAHHFFKSNITYSKAGHYTVTIRDPRRQIVHSRRLISCLEYAHRDIQDFINSQAAKDFMEKGAA